MDTNLRKPLAFAFAPGFALYAFGLAIGAVGLVAIPDASAACQVSLLAPCDGGNCFVNIGVGAAQCNGGNCLINIGSCDSGGTCTVNVAAQCPGGDCLVNVQAICRGACPVNVATTCP